GERYGHVQEVIVQNFRAKPGTRMAQAPEPPLDELLWTAAAARILLGPQWSIQCPPNLSYDDFPRLLEAGIDDWGGVSPVTGGHAALEKVRDEHPLDEDDATALLRARGAAFRGVLRAADDLRREVCGDTVTYVVTRNVNYTNVCYFRCGFCAFSKGRLAANL